MTSLTNDMKPPPAPQQNIATIIPPSNNNTTSPNNNTWCAYHVSYIIVHEIPAVYNGKTTDQSHDSCTAAHPNNAPQLNANPNTACG